MVKDSIEIAKQNTDIKRVIVFGSAVTDQCREDSDIDFCFDVADTFDEIKMVKTFGRIGAVCERNADRLIYSALRGKIKNEVNTKGVIVYELS